MHTKKMRGNETSDDKKELNVARATPVHYQHHSYFKAVGGFNAVSRHFFERASETTIKYCRPRVGVVRGHCMVSGGRREWTK